MVLTYLDDERHHLWRAMNSLCLVSDSLPHPPLHLPPCNLNMRGQKSNPAENQNQNHHVFVLVCESHGTILGVTVQVFNVHRPLD